MKYLLALVLALGRLAAPWALAADSPQSCWLIQEVKRGGFTVKFFLTERHRQALEAENLRALHPGGQYGQPLELSESTRRQLVLGGAEATYMEVWRGPKLVYILNAPGAFEQFAGFEKVFMKQDDFPKPGQVTYALYYNTGREEALKGRNLMLTLGPKEERLTSYQTDCYYDILYERVSGGYPDDEFERQRRPAGAPARRLVCDPKLDKYGQLGRGGLPRPVRIIVFDEKEDRWRADRPGEYPGFYFNQIPITLEYSGLAFQTAPPRGGGRAEMDKSARALMAEIQKDKTRFVKKTRTDLALVTYSLLMMGLPEPEVKEFFLTLAAEYAKVRGSFNWSKAKPDKVFADIAAAAGNFQPIERDQIFR